MIFSVKRSAENLDKSKCLVIFTYLFLRQNGYVYVKFFLFCDCISWYCSIIGKISIFSNLVHEIYAAIYIVYCSKAKVRFNFWSTLGWDFNVLFVNYIPDDLVWIRLCKTIDMILTNIMENRDIKRNHWDSCV